MDFSAFSHGQIHSKLWLCEQLEPYLPKKANLLILASWYNILGMILLIRNPQYTITSIEQNIKSINIANKICDAWMINNDQSISNKKGDIHDIDIWDYDCIINTSVEDIRSSQWYEKIPEGKLVVLQSTNLIQDDVNRYKNWNILNPNPDMETFKEKYQINDIIFEGSKEFDYGDLKYSRYMLIGKK